MNTHSLHGLQGCVNDYFYKSRIILYGSFMKKILISSCLAGERVRYDGKQIPIQSRFISRWRKDGRLVTVCPEVLGGLPIPRPAAQIVDGSGEDVVHGVSKVVDVEGNNVTRSFTDGASQTLAIAREYKITVAVFKEKSPSCGVHQIYDGTFSSVLIPGSGVAVALLKAHGIQVFSEHELSQVQEIIEKQD